MPKTMHSIKRQYNDCHSRLSGVLLKKDSGQAGMTKERRITANEASTQNTLRGQWPRQLARLAPDADFDEALTLSAP
jgi:hypothetical protein